MLKNISEYLRYEWSLVRFAFSGRFWRFERWTGGFTLLMAFLNKAVELPDGWPSFVVEELPLYVFGFLFCGTVLVGYSIAPYVLQKRMKGLLDVEQSTDALSKFIAGRDSFTLKEAACIKAASPITHGEVTGAASGYLHDLKKIVISGKIAIKNSPHPFIGRQLNFQRRNPAFSKLPPLTAIELEALEAAEILKEDLIALGFIDEDEKPQLPQENEVKKLH